MKLSWRAAAVTGVDIDEALISAAWKRRRNIWSLQRPDTSKDDADTQMGVQDEGPAATYFPASCLHTHGPLPLPTRTDATHAQFPHNVVFRAQDWMDAAVERYDVILALSITKWIHLNRGDHGIRACFAKVAASLSAGGYFLLEAQSWEGYTKAKRMSATLKANYQTLQLRPADFHDILVGIGFERETSFDGEGHSSADGFQRRLDVYRKK